MRSVLHIFTERRMAVLLALGFSSGLPLALTGDTLQAWLKLSGMKVETIGLLGLVGLPYALKFVWAPVMDRFAIPLLGRRRGWLLVTQLLLMAGIGLLGMQSPEKSVTRVAILALVVAFLSASQDIVFDAYRTDLLDEDERGPGVAVTVTGYRAAMIVSAAGALMLARVLPWAKVYLLMAMAMGVGLIATLFAPEPKRKVAAPESLVAAVVDPLVQFLRASNGLLILGFVVLFKLPDVMAGAMSQVFLLDIGHTAFEIGSIRQGLGLAVTIVGAVVGGGLTTRMGLRRSLWLFALLQTASNAGFLMLSFTGRNYPVMVSVIVVENFCAGLVTAGFTAFLMSRCDVRYSATQFALLSSLMALTRVLGGAPTGFIVHYLGWPWFFFTTIVAGAPGIVLLPWVLQGVDAEAVPQESQVAATSTGVAQ